MVLLAIDTSSQEGSLATAKLNGPQISELYLGEWQKHAGHSELATIELEKLLTRAGLSLRQLTHLVVNVGPGSFTGIRVGLSVARSLAYALKLPLAPISSLENMAHFYGQGETRVFVAHKAVQKFYYCAGYVSTEHGWKVELEPLSALESELANLHSSYPKVLIEGVTPNFRPHSRAQGLIEIVAKNLKNLHFLPWSQVGPLYVRASEAEEKLKRGIFALPK